MPEKWEDRDLGLMIRLLNPYSTDMVMPPAGESPTTGAAARPAATSGTSAPATPETDLGQYQVEIDNYEGVWDFKGNTHKITRALRITYRYPVKDGHGILATEHLLVGYAGGNGG
jgi:hypothetical protein